jgi:hypothetical protein
MDTGVGPIDYAVWIFCLSFLLPNIHKIFLILYPLPFMFNIVMLLC